MAKYTTTNVAQARFHAASNGEFIYFTQSQSIQCICKCITLGISVFGTVTWCIYALIALVNNPDSQTTALCPKSKVFLLLIFQIIGTIGFIVNHCYKYYYLTKPHVQKPIHTYIMYMYNLVIVFWSLGELFTQCAKEKFMNIDTYLSARVWFVVVVTVLIIELGMKCWPTCKNKCKKLCTNVSFTPRSQAQHRIVQNPDAHNPLHTTTIPTESEEYAEL